MQVQINTENGVGNRQTLERWATAFLTETLARFAQDIIRVELKLGEEARTRSGAVDKRCLLEARLPGRQPLAVEHHAETQDAAIRGAAQRLVNALDHSLGKLDRHDHRDRETIRRPEDTGA